ncbi:MAG TPA: hypothetical protein VFW73_08625 [Lacipirellulaceae bacterium]|nr:hypothetical protein [Lacipirellulaceae bacterium]
MARDEDDDLYNEEFDFVDDDEETQDDGVDEDSEMDEDASGGGASDGENAGEELEAVDEYGRPETPPANYVVHIYEHKKFKRTIDRPFTPEDAESFATEFNRTSKNYGRFALAGKNETKPKKTLD